MNRTIHRRKTTGFFLTVFLMLAISVLLTGCGQKTLQIKVIDKQEKSTKIGRASCRERV